MAKQTEKPIIGLTGGIGSGKSTVGRILADLGCTVSNSDEDARQVLQSPDVRETLRNWWGDAILDEQGDVDRSRVASIVFQDEEQRKRLEGLIHPRVEALRRARFAAAPENAPALVIDAPLLIEAGLDAACDHVIFVDSDRQLRIERLRRTRGWGEAELCRREESQLPLDRKRSRADYVVVNNDDLGELERQVRQILLTIVSSTVSEPQS